MSQFTVTSKPFGAGEEIRFLDVTSSKFAVVPEVYCRKSARRIRQTRKPNRTLRLLARCLGYCLRHPPSLAVGTRRRACRRQLGGRQRPANAGLGRPPRVIQQRRRKLVSDARIRCTGKQHKIARLDLNADLYSWRLDPNHERVTLRRVCDRRGTAAGSCESIGKGLRWEKCV